MLSLQAKGTVKSVVLRKEWHGDESEKAVTVKVEFEGVDLSVVQAGFVSQLGLVFDEDGDPALTELKPLKVSRRVDDAHVQIGRAKLPKMDVGDVTLTPIPGSKVDVTLKLSGGCPSGVTDILHDALFELVKVSIKEPARGEGARPH